MTVNELIKTLRALSYVDRANVDAVVRYLDESYDIDAVRIERLAGNENEPARTVLAIRVEPDGER